MVYQNFQKHLAKSQDAIEYCIRIKAIVPALVLIYSLIDMFSWLNRPANRVDSTKEDFLEWCESFLMPVYNGDASSIDLYASRCAVVHTGTPGSRLSKEGKARRISYCCGGNLSLMQETANAMKEPAYSGICVDVCELYQATKRAIEESRRRISSSPDKEELYMKRIKELYYL